MPRGLTTQTFSGKSLETIHQELKDYLLRAEYPVRIEDAMTALGYTDTFARDAIKRSFTITLRPGGANEQLTLKKKWLRNREKWATDLVDQGKVNLTFAKTTVPTDTLSDRIKELNGQLSPEVQQAALNIRDVVAERSNQKFDRNSVAYIAEDVSTILSDNAALSRENQLHEKYRMQNEQQMHMMQELIAELTGRRGIVPRSN